MRLLPVTPTEVLNTINNFENNVVAGTDEFKPVLIKYVSLLIFQVVPHIVNIPLGRDAFPGAFNITRVCPIYKGGGKYNLQYDGPISMLLIIIKVFERLLYKSHEILLSLR